MTMNGARGYHPGLVDLTTGQICREIFVNEDSYTQEQERVFARLRLRMPGRVVDLTQAQASEEPMRNLDRRWAEFMQADSWIEVMTWRHTTSPAARAAE